MVVAETRRAVRDHMRGGAFLDTCVRDIRTLLREDVEELIEYGPEAFDEVDVVNLWDTKGRTVAGGTSYGEDDE
ncbi:hypothetical protein [Lentzea sp. CA-135723]|uniref:hypothetical protein n=1 Tax=Lentzea sp. CA-135723 TaxID=3239950 RepID=UPI003D90C2DC